LLPELSESELKVLIVLAIRARDTQGAATDIPIAVIYRATGLSRRSVSKAIKNLAAKNLLAVRVQHGPRGEYMSNIYHPLLKNLVAGPEDFSIDDS